MLVCWKGFCLFCFLEVLKLKAKKQETFETHKDFVQVRNLYPNTSPTDAYFGS